VSQTHALRCLCLWERIHELIRFVKTREEQTHHRLTQEREKTPSHEPHWRPIYGSHQSVVCSSTTNSDRAAFCDWPSPVYFNDNSSPLTYLHTMQWHNDRERLTEKDLEGNSNQLQIINQRLSGNRTSRSSDEHSCLAFVRSWVQTLTRGTAMPTKVFVVFLSPYRQIRDSTANYTTTASFQTFSNSSVISRTLIRRYII
jgi:hypothetical protein